ncbi:MAG: hypothetical protein LBN36_04420 [Clostridiales Family XIII bacterium]|jgi:Na+/H+ antiporter NhaC|nr:hypothetical protein [Clostridiales Family XIII bacterium]
MDSPIVLIPIATIFVVAVLSKRTLVALLCGLIVASTILAGNITGIVPNVFTYVYSSMSNETAQWLILVIALFGMLIVLLERSKSVVEFGNWASKFIKTPRQALLGTFILGIIVFVDDYLNNLAVGTTMKAITDKHGIPRTQLGYVVNSAAAPVCIIIPISTWAVYFAGLFEAEGILVDGSGIGAYISSIPFMFYGWFALIILFLQIVGIIPKFGLIKKDYARVAETGDVFPEGTDVVMKADAQKDADTPDNAVKPSNPLFFLLPIIILIVVTLVFDKEILYGVSAAVVFSIIAFAVCRKMKFGELLTACFDGVLTMGFTILLTVMAFAVQGANLDLGLADYVIALVAPLMNGGFLPVVVFLFCAIYAFTTGCFWDMAVIITPIVLPLALVMGVNPILAGAAVFSGAAFGSTTCFYGDAVILASQACGIRAIDQMRGTLPYAVVAAVLSAIAFLITGFVL